MNLVYIMSVLLTAGYTVLMLVYRKGWFKVPEFTLSALYVPSTRISVIVPARNEAGNIGACLESLLNQKYPDYLYEVIVVDDHSEDDTVGIAYEYARDNIRCISLSEFIPMGNPVNSYKKIAIAAGINQSTGELIVTTDADCTLPNTWLMHIAAMYEQRQPVMIVAPVIYTIKRNLVQLFQLIDFMSMQGITAAAHALKLGNMSNGANLAFRKTAFDTVGGYDGIQSMASGDDYLLMMKMNKLAPDGICYLKSANATVSTLAQPDWRSFFQQRIRWASKSGKYNDTRLTLILVLVYLFNLMLLALAVGSIFIPAFRFMTAAILVIKIAAEYYFLKPVARFFNNEWVLWYFPFLQPLHVLYIVSAGFLGFLGGYEWKGRRVK